MITDEDRKAHSKKIAGMNTSQLLQQKPLAQEVMEREARKTAKKTTAKKTTDK